MASQVRSEVRQADPASRDEAADPDLEADVAKVAAWFDALPEGLRAYLDAEAEVGRSAYIWP